MSGIMNGCVGVLKKKAPVVPYVKGGINIGSFNGKTYYVAPKAAQPTYFTPSNAGETSLTWGSYGTKRNTSSTTDGVTNSNILNSFGQTAHPAAYFCRQLTNGAYRDYYLPAKDELNFMYTNRLVVNASNAGVDAFTNSVYWSSTEAVNDGNNAWFQYFVNGSQYFNGYKLGSYGVRAVRSQ